MSTRVSQGLSTEADLAAVFSEEGTQAAFESFDQACAELQRIADENEIDVRLDCGDEEESGEQPAPSE